MNHKPINRSRKNRRNRRLKRKMIMSMMLLLFFGICCLQFGKVLTDAHGDLNEDPIAFKYYKSIEIKSGDTLWGIAEKYMCDEYDSIYEYIDEIKNINHLASDDIQSEEYLTIAYYDYEYK